MTRRNDEGFTLVELLVTTTLLGIVLSLATVSYVTGLHVSDDNSARAEATNDAATGLEAVSRGLRTAVTGPNGAPAFTDANRTMVLFWSTLDASYQNGLSTVRYWAKSDGTLVEQFTPGGSSMRQRILARGLRRTDVFSFFRNQPDPSDATKQQLVEIASVPVTGADLSAIRVVGTRLSLRARDRGDAPAVTAETRTFLVNKDYGESGC